MKSVLRHEKCCEWHSIVTGWNFVEIDCQSTFLYLGLFTTLCAFNGTILYKSNFTLICAILCYLHMDPKTLTHMYEFP